MDTVVQGYQPLDLAQIQKALPKNFKKIQSDKELESEVVELGQILKDLAADWKKRSEACQRIQAIAFLFDGVCSGQISKINVNFYIQQVNKLGNVLSIQIHDLRSMSAKSASVTIQVLAQNLGNDFEILALKLITKDALLKVIHSANKTLADHAHQAILSILNHVCVPKLIPRLQAEMQVSKSTQFHQKMSQYLYVLVSLYPYEGVLDKHAQSIDQYIQQSVSDANSEARLNGRKSFLIWQKLAPDNAQSLFMQFDYQSQKAIIEEQEKFADHDGELYDAGMEHSNHIPPKQSSLPHNSKKNTFFSSNNNQQSTMSGSNTNNTSLFGGSVGGVSSHQQAEGARKNQYNQMGQWEMTSPNPQFGSSTGGIGSSSGNHNQASAGRAGDKRGSLRNVSTSNNTRKSNHSRQSRGSRGGGGQPSHNQNVPGNQATHGASNQRRSLGLNNQRQYSGSTSQNRQQNIGVNMNQVPQQNAGAGGYPPSQYSLQNMAAGQDHTMHSEQQSNNSEVNLHQQQAHNKKNPAQASGTPSAFRHGQQNQSKSQYPKQYSISGQATGQSHHNESNQQINDQKIDFYNKGLTQNNSPGLRSAGGLPGVSNDDMSDGFQQYSHDQYQQYGKQIPQRPSWNDLGVAQSADIQPNADDRKYHGGEPVGKQAYGRRQIGGIHSQYGNFQGGKQRADEEMDIEPMIGGSNPQLGLQDQQQIPQSKKQTTSYAKISKMIKSHNWSQRAQALEDFLRYLIEMQPSELMNEFNHEREFSPLVDQIIQKLDSETVIKIIEISLDLIELLLSSLPECLISNIDQVLICFLKQLGNRREMISDKANDLINLARETLGADFLLPHFVTILNGMASDSSNLKTKISALDVMNVLIRESESLQESEQDTYIQYAAVVKTLGNILKMHSSQRAIMQPIIGCIQELRDQNAQITFKAIYEELSHTQYVMLKSILNHNDKQLSRQLADFQASQGQNIDQEQEQDQNSLNYGGKYGSGSLSISQSDKHANRKGSQVTSAHGSTHNMTAHGNVNRTNVDTTAITESNTRSRASQSSAAIGNNFGVQSKQIQENPQRVSYSKNKSNAGQPIQQNLIEPQRKGDEQSSYSISQVPSSQALSTGDKQSPMSLGGQQMQQKDQQLKQHCQVLLKNVEQNDLNVYEQYLIKQSKSIKGIQQLIVPAKDQTESEEAHISSKQICINLIVNNFQMLVEALLFIIIKQTAATDSNPSDSMGSNQSTSPSQSLRNQSIETLTYVLKQWHRNKMKIQASEQSVGSMSKQIREGSQTLERYREEILVNTLKAYSPDIAPQHQCITNQVAEDLLEWLVIASDSEFLSNTIEPLLRHEQPPRLQALLRMIQNKLRYIQKLVEQRTNSPDIGQHHFSLLIQHLLQLADVLCVLMSNANADVRKSVVFCLVEIHSILQNNELFQQAFANKLNQSQQKLVDIYITRKRQTTH